MIGPRAQKRLALLAAASLALLVLAANIHLVVVASATMPACVQPDPGRPPARPGC